jgi:hypothetical protein
MKKIIMSLFLVVLCNQIFSQSISRIEPANWWTGMKWNKITLLIYGSKIKELTPTIVYEGVSIDKVEKVENPNYLFVTLNINSEAKSGTLKLNFKKGRKTIIAKDFPLLEREKNSANRESFSQKDNILLVVPDRFSNGNPSNDNTNNTIEKFDRNLEGGRHGGDIQGIINNLDYIQSLGYTQI